jgi:hypothetical protein
VHTNNKGSHLFENRDMDKIKKKTDNVENIRQMKDIENLAKYSTLGPGVEIHEIYENSFKI